MNLSWGGHTISPPTKQKDGVTKALRRLSVRQPGSGSKRIKFRTQR